MARSIQVWILRLVRALGLYPAARRLRVWMDHHLPRRRRRRQQLKAFYGRFIKRDDLCFDVGANIGDRAELFRELGARVVCVEPQADCVAFLRRRFKGDSGVVIVTKVVGDRDGNGRLHVCDDNSGLATMSRGWTEDSPYADRFEWKRSVEVEMTRLDTLVSEHGTPAFCKIDVEGFEESVLKGLSHPLPMISIEMTGDRLEALQSCMDCLLALGPVTFNSTIRDATDFESPEWLAAGALRARLSAMEKVGLWGDVYCRSGVGVPTE